MTADLQHGGSDLPAEMRSLHTCVRSSSIWVVARFALTAPLGLLFNILIIRGLSVEDYGTYSVIFTIPGYIAVFSSFGLVPVFRRYLPEFYRQQKIGAFKSLVLRGLLLRLLLSSIAIALIAICSQPVGRLLNIEDWLDYFLAFALGIVFFHEVGLLNVVLGSVFLHKYSTIAQVIYSPTRLAVAYLAIRSDSPLYNLLITETVSWGLWAGLLLFFYYFKFVRPNPSGDTPGLRLRRLVRYGGLTFLNDAGGSLLSESFGYLVLSAFLGPAQVAIYAFPTKIMKTISRVLPHRMLIDVVRPAFYSKYAETGDSTDLVRMFTMLVKLSAFCSIPITVVILTVGDQIILHIFGERYMESLVPFWIVAIFTTVNIVIALPSGLVLHALEQVQVMLYSRVFAAYSLVGSLLVVTQWGVLGVTLVTGSAVLFKNLFCYYYAREFAGLRIDWHGMFRTAIHGGCMGLALLAFRPTVSGLPTLAAVVLIGGIVYAASAFLWKAFTEAERTLINKILPSPVFVF